MNLRNERNRKDVQKMNTAAISLVFFLATVIVGIVCRVDVYKRQKSIYAEADPARGDYRGL